MELKNDNDKDKKEYLKKYYEKNKEKIKDKMKEMVKCECGGEYTKYNKANHEKTIRHINNLKKMNEESEDIRKKLNIIVKKKMEESMNNIEKKIKEICEKEIIDDAVEKIIKDLSFEIASLKK